MDCSWSFQTAKILVLVAMVTVVVANLAKSEDIQFQLTAQPAEQPRQPPRRQPPRRSTRPVNPFRAASRRFASTPAPMGDFPPGPIFTAATGVDFVRSPLLVVGRIPKITDGSSAVPTDRCYADLRFATAVQDRRPAMGAPVGRFAQVPIQQYTLGIERICGGGASSVEVRMPFTGQFTSDSPDLDQRGGHIGNVSAIFKRLIYTGQVYASSIGVGVSAPTGSDIQGRLPTPNFNFTTCNDAVHLLPFWGFVYDPGGAFFAHSFVQMDIPVNGNRIAVTDVGAATTTTGVITEQMYLFLDAAGGIWLLTDPPDYIDAVAGLFELHVTTPLSNRDTIPFAAPLSFGASDKTLVNMTLGLHFELAGGCQLRVGGVIPLSTRENRLFDGELVVSIIRPLR